MNGVLWKKMGASKSECDCINCEVPIRIGESHWITKYKMPDDVVVHEHVSCPVPLHTAAEREACEAEEFLESPDFLCRGQE